MSGKPAAWPKWPEYTQDKAERTDDLSALKKEILEQFGAEKICQSWLKTCAELAKVTDTIAKQGTFYIPVVQYEELFTLSKKRKQELKDIGGFVVRNVVDKAQVDKWFAELKHYVAENRAKLTGWPVETPFVLNLYYSPPQVAARSHPHAMRLAKELNSWWDDSSNSTTSDPLTYVDAVRIRPPGTPMYGLGPHIDAGSLSRWADPTYRACYASVFGGNPEELDLYNIALRKDAKQALYQSTNHSAVFRAFQGWTALTSAGAGEGSLMLFPSVKWGIAYVLLRPFFREPQDGDVLDASKWTLDVDSSWFPGTWRYDSQFLSASSHPHLRLKECLVSIPKVYPGDTVWWHADMCHAVEVQHDGDHEASVIYIAATPSTSVNKKYIDRQLKDFLAGRAPEDFRDIGLKMVPETELDGHKGEAAILCAEGRKAMGFA